MCPCCGSMPIRKSRAKRFTRSYALVFSGFVHIWFARHRVEYSSIHEVAAAAAAAASDNFVYIFGEPFVVAASARDFLINHFRNRFSVWFRERFSVFSIQFCCLPQRGRGHQISVPAYKHTHTHTHAENWAEKLVLNKKRSSFFSMNRATTLSMGPLRSAWMGILATIILAINRGLMLPHRFSV